MNNNPARSEPREEKPGFFSSIYDKVAESLSANCGCCKRSSGQKERMYITEKQPISTSGDYFDMEHHDFEEVAEKDNRIKRQETELSTTRFQDGTIENKDYAALNYDFSDYENETTTVKKAITKKVKGWTKKDDDLLISLAEKFNGKNWRDITKCFQGRTAPECRQRWKKLRPSKKRKPWDAHEDQKLFELVKVHGHDWAAISNNMVGRSGKQVRERFLNTLDPAINKEKWSKQEDKIILTMYYQIGSKWSEISKVLNNRPENMVKNRFYSHIKKKLLAKGEDHSVDDFDDFSSETGATVINGGNLSSLASQGSPVHENGTRSLMEEEGPNTNGNGNYKPGLPTQQSKEMGEMEVEGEVTGNGSRPNTIERGMSDELERIRNQEDLMDMESGFAFRSDEPVEREEKPYRGERMSRGSSSGESVSSYLDMKQGADSVSEMNMMSLEFAIHEADDKMKQAYYILSNQLVNGSSAVNLSEDITRLKMMIDALKSKKNYLEEAKRKK